MIFSNFNGTGTIASGTFSKNTAKYSMGYMRQVLVSPTTSTNIYDVSFVDEKGFTVYSQSAAEGSFSEHKVDVPLVGVYTFRIDNATIDEDFKYEVLIQED